MIDYSHPVHHRKRESKRRERVKGGTEREREREKIITGSNLTHPILAYNNISYPKLTLPAQTFLILTLPTLS
jgi:hypothetical protein